MIFILIRISSRCSKSEFIYRKQRAGNSLLRAESSHPKHVIKNLPIGEYIRAKRSCSVVSEYEKQCKIIDNRLMDRGYSKALLHRAKNIANSKTRLHHLFGDNKKRQQTTNSDRTLTFVTPFSSHYNQVVAVMKKYLPILSQDTILDQILGQGVKFVACKAKNIGNILSPSSLDSEQKTTWLNTKGCYKCAGNRCGSCKYITNSNTFQSYNTNKVFPIKTLVNCNTSHVVYLINCDICRKQYVGSRVRKFKTRIGEHVGGIRVDASSLRNISNVSKHFRDTHHGDTTGLRILAIERVFKPQRGGDWVKRVRQREAYWILQLDTRFPAGLNFRTDLMYLY